LFLPLLLLSNLLLKFFTLFLSSLFSFKMSVSQDIEVEQTHICEEHGIYNKSSQEVDTCLFSTSQRLATSCDPSDELSLVLVFSFEGYLVRKA
jgi:hypothetical protein